jgi:hypothetical protein
MEVVFSQQAELDLEVERYEIEQRLQRLERFEREHLSASIPPPFTTFPTEPLSRSRRGLFLCLFALSPPRCYGWRLCSAACC